MVQHTVKAKDLYTLFEYDIRSFIVFNLQEQGIKYEDVTDMQIAGVKTMIGSGDPEADAEKTAFAWPRDYSKTTTLKIAMRYKIIYHHNTNLIYATASSPQDKDAVTDIVSKLMTDRFVAIYGEPVFLTKSRSSGEYLFRYCGKNIILRGRTKGKDIRGTNVDDKRPDFIGFDDIEKKGTDSDTKEGYEGTSEWFQDTASKSLCRFGGSMVYLGNLVSEPSILLDIQKDPTWTYIRFSAINKAGMATWPERYSLSFLAQELSIAAANGKAVGWMGERMNIPPSKLNNMFSLKNIQFVQDIQPRDPRIKLRCITVDPAISTSSKADGAVICAHGFVDGTWRLLEMVKKQGPNVFDFAKDIIDLAVKWDIGVIGVEAVAYQQALLQVCEEVCAKMLITWIKFIPVYPGKVSKAVRITTFINMLSINKYLLPQRYSFMLMKAMRYRPDSREHDDELDVCAYLIKMLQDFSEEMYQDLSRLSKQPKYVSQDNVQVLVG